MATVKRKVIGEFIGTVGDIVQRRRYGKIVAYSRPGKFRKSNSPEAKEGRIRFALSVALARLLVKIPELKLIWKLAPLEGVVPYNRIIKYNRNLSADTHLTTLNIITPESSPLNITECVIEYNEITIQIIPQDYQSNSIFSRSNMFYSAFYLYEQREQMMNSYLLKVHMNIFDGFPIGSAINLRIKIPSTIFQNINNYRKLIFYCAASNNKFTKKVLQWTSTYSKEFDL